MGGLAVLGRTYRHLNRYREVAAILTKHGFGDLLHVLKLDSHLEAGLHAVMKHPPVDAASRPERVRLAIQELGTTFVKAGQYLSTRSDLLAPEYLRELAKLQDRVPPFPGSEARHAVEKELGAPLSRHFSRFDLHPLAAASIAQIHAAALRDGREVVVKVLRPDVRRLVAVDLEIMTHLAGLAEKHLEAWRPRRPKAVVAEIARSLDREMDLSMEAAHTERFARQFADDATVRVPATHRALSSAQILTLERLDGVKPGSARALERAGLDPRVAAERLAAHYLAMIFTHGFFHADPHPGNILVQPDHVIAYLDFGMMGRLDRGSREALADVVFALSERDEARLARALLALADKNDEPDPHAFEADMAELMDQYAYRPLSEWRLGRMLEQLFQTTARHDVRIPPDLFLMVKALTELESLALLLDPRFDAVTACAPFVRRVHEERASPARLTERLTQAGRETLNLLASAPGELRALIQAARRGRLLIEFEHKGLEPTLAELDQISNRLAFAVLLGSLVIGSALLVHSGLPPHWRGMPVLGLAGFLLSALMAFWLLLAILRHGRL
ncbi:MAG: AarF/ABC1/UbiB kinase family protein [Elusimicrobia bacterium]|nr:AarF/ABC1/UbiB kinase family protein [Elusimicrobiota bacterium]